MNGMNEMNEMHEMKQVQNDEIDLFELFQTLWDGKWLISAFVAIAVLLGGGLVFVKDEDKAPLYESKLIYSVDTLPPFYNENNALTDFHKKFYSINVFEDWKKSNGNVSLVFSDFADTEVVDGFVLSKNESQRLATLSTGKKGGSFVLVKSKQLPLLDDFFKYAQHINEILKNEYITRSSEELEFLESRFVDVNFPDSYIFFVRSVRSIHRYIASAEKGANVFAIQRPTMPKTINPKKSKSSLILAMSVVLGGLIGVFFILVRNAIKKRKEPLA